MCTGIAKIFRDRSRETFDIGIILDIGQDISISRKYENSFIIVKLLYHFLNFCLSSQVNCFIKYIRVLLGKIF